MGEQDPPDAAGASGAAPVGRPRPSTAPEAAGDQLAGPDQAVAEFTAFYSDNVPRLVRFLIVDGAPPALAAELVQDVMTALWRCWHTVASPGPWTRTAASRAWIRYRTRVPELPTDIPDSVLLSSHDAGDIDVRHDLLRLLDRLTPRQRQVMARTYDGDTPAEIAAELQITEATVRSLLRNARHTMAEHRDSRREGTDR